MIAPLAQDVLVTSINAYSSHLIRHGIAWKICRLGTSLALIFWNGRFSNYLTGPSTVSPGAHPGLTSTILFYQGTLVRCWGVCRCA